MSDWPLASAYRFETLVRWSAYVVATIPLITLTSALTVSGFASLTQHPVAVLVATGCCLAVTIGSVFIVRRTINTVTSAQPPTLPSLQLGWVVVGIGIAVLLRFLPLPGTQLTVAAIITCAATCLAPLLTARHTAILTMLVLAAIILLTFSAGRERVIVDATLMALILWTSWLSAWTLRVLRELQLVQEERATHALTNERLRIARDLHDIFGRTLATISVKSGLASELIGRGRNTDASSELTDIQRITDHAGTEVRNVVRGETRTTWNQEVSGARALLQSAGITCIIDTDDIPPHCTEPFGWVIREAITNILRHSNATTVDITTRTTTHAATLTITNDGAPTAPLTPPGTGLNAMRTRLSTLHGTLTTHHEHNQFALTATIPESSAAQ